MHVINFSGFQLDVGGKLYNLLLEYAKSIYPLDFDVCYSVGGKLFVAGVKTPVVHWVDLESGQSRKQLGVKGGDMIVPVTRMSSVHLLENLRITSKQADFFDELADLLAKHSASIASNSNLNIQIKGRTIPHKGKAGRWCGSSLVEGKIISAKTIRKFRLRSKVV